jgi:hypothetical protein
VFDDENLVGKWAVCGHGRIGRIEGRKQLEWGLSWIGTGVDGRPWASTKPTVICDADGSFLDHRDAAPARGVAGAAPILGRSPAPTVIVASSSRAREVGQRPAPR